MRWMWIDRVIELRPRQRLVAIKNISLAEEHLHQHFAATSNSPALPIMPASLILEGMAQSGGILVGHAHDFKYNVVLAKINKAEITRDAAPGHTLRYTATVERMDDIGCSVVGTIERFDHASPDSGWLPIGHTEMMFSHLDNNQGGGGQAGVDFPAGNFVFGEGGQFKTLLRSSGY